MYIPVGYNSIMRYLSCIKHYRVEIYYYNKYLYMKYIGICIVIAYMELCNVILTAVRFIT